LKFWSINILITEVCEYIHKYTILCLVQTRGKTLSHSIQVPASSIYYYFHDFYIWIICNQVTILSTPGACVIFADQSSISIILIEQCQLSSLKTTHNSSNSEPKISSQTFSERTRTGNGTVLQWTWEKLVCSYVNHTESCTAYVQ